jgi:hypothetical protein
MAKKKSKKKIAGYKTTTELTPRDLFFATGEKPKVDIPLVGKRVGYKFHWTVTPPLSYLDSAIDSSAAREQLANAVGYNAGQSLASDEGRYLIQKLLVDEIQRLRSELEALKCTTRNYLSVLEKEKEQNANLQSKQA